MCTEDSIQSKRIFQRFLSKKNYQPIEDRAPVTHLITPEKDSITLEKDSITLEKDSMTPEKDSITLEKDSITLQNHAITRESFIMPAETWTLQCKKGCPNTVCRDILLHLYQILPKEYPYFNFVKGEAQK